MLNRRAQHGYKPADAPLLYSQKRPGRERLKLPHEFLPSLKFYGYGEYPWSEYLVFTNCPGGTKRN